MNLQKESFAIPEKMPSKFRVFTSNRLEARSIA